jgi:hypothetical protein
MPNPPEDDQSGRRVKFASPNETTIILIKMAIAALT